MNEFSLKCISEEDFLNMKEEWNALLDRGGSNECFLLWEWIYCWWQLFKEKNRRLYILAGRNCNNEAIGIAPFYVENNKIFRFLSRKSIRFCSSLETYPDHLDVICRNEYENSFIEAVLNYLIKNHKDWDSIRIDGVKENSAVKKYLTNIKNLKKEIIIDFHPSSICPYVTVEGSYKEYIGSFSKAKKRTISRYRKLLLEKEKMEYGNVKNHDELEDYIEHLFMLHAERAKRKGIRSTFCEDRVLNFHKNIIKRLFNKDKIRIFYLKKNSKPIAIIYCIRHANKYYMYQSGLSSEGEKNSAGTVLLSLCIEDAFRENCHEIDFLRGREKYKFLWTDKFREDYSIEIIKNHLIQRMFHMIGRGHRINKILGLVARILRERIKR